MSVEIEKIVTQRRTSMNTAAAEIWIAYLHLMKAKDAVKDQVMVNELQGLMEAALDAFRRHQVTSARALGRSKLPY
jgi:hypothetical protein